MSIEYLILSLVGVGCWATRSVKEVMSKGNAKTLQVIENSPPTRVVISLVPIMYVLRTSISMEYPCLSPELTLERS